MATTTTFASTPDLTHEAELSSQDGNAASIPSTPPPTDHAVTAGRPRATSLATRNANRLSLTLPIAPPTSYPSRPTPVAAGSVPPTPVDTSAATSPTDPNDFIIAIAAQERRVLELREELVRAEAELSSLKRQWTAQDTLLKRNGLHRADSRRSLSQADEESLSARRSLDADRRKLLLQTQSTPTQGRRKVIRGGHARTLSLLSPVKTDGGFADLQEPVDAQPLKLPPADRRTAQLLNPNLSKRASWQPRSHQSTPSVPSIVEDFRLGLRAFVEDIRQITVGDEPIKGQNMRDSPVGRRDGAVVDESDPGFDTIKPSNSVRPKVSSIFDSPGSAAPAPTPGSKESDTHQDKPKAVKNKRFSWTPLGLDSLDDNAWSNWESPVSIKSARWSGSTVNSNSDDVADIQSIAEREEENVTPIKKKAALADAPSLSPRLEEILPSMVNRLSPSNIKRTANHLLDEWEKSLMAPEAADKENQA
ncbi:hypothetical protein HJFPF1_11367 [Paramyrothecium foliicola]|nr:hypothetical protein HJFPF1_11367 [Paramyrothecium foliicola]